MRVPDVVHVAITRPRGVDIMSFVTVEYNGDNTIRWTREASSQNIQLEVDKVASYPDAAGEVQSWRPIDPKDLPEQIRDATGHRIFRPALRDTGTGFVFDLDHAQQLGLAYVRELREPMLDALDKRWMNALGQGDMDTAKSLEHQRQALRDLPATVNVKQNTVGEIFQTLISAVGVIEDQSRLVLQTPIVEKP